MFLSIKKQTLIYGFSILLAVSLLTLCVAVKEAKEDINPSVPTMSTGLAGKKVLIDAGHGGFDAGASANGILEKDINLSVALKLKQCIEENGGNAIMTREEDCSTAGSEDAKGKSAKISDLKNRRAMADESGADIFVSIHMNKFPQEKYKGAQVFYADNSEESRKLGEIIQKTLPETLNDGNTRAAKGSGGSIFILKDVKIPSVIVECGFISNPEEAENLKNNDYQNKLAWAIYLGIDNYFKEEQ